MSKLISAAAMGRSVPVTASEAAGAPRRLSRAALLFGTALGCSIAVVAAGAPNAAFAGTCTSVVSSGTDTVTCTAGDYPTGITYSEGGLDNVVVILDGGITVESTTDGVFVNGANNYNAGLTTASGDTVTSTGNGETLFASGTGNATMDNGAAVSAYGRGLNVFASGTGNVSLTNTGDITVKNALGAGYAEGILVQADAGNAYVNNSGAISVNNSSTGTSYGILNAVNGDLTELNSGAITVTDSGAGNAYGIRNAVGFTATDVYMNNSGAITVTATGTGNAIGLEQGGSGDVTIIQSGAVTTSAQSGEAAGVITYATGNLSVTTGAVSATSATGYALGVSARSTGGNTSVASTGPIYASGNTAVGVNAYSETGTTVVNVGNVTSYSAAGTSVAHGYGIKAVGSGDVVVTAGSVVTSGDYATGVYAHSTAGNVSMSVTSVSTTGYAANGVTAYAPGNVTVNTNSVSTTGNFATGISADSGTEYASVVSGDVVTTGFAAVGINAYGHNGATVVAVSTVTSGDFSDAIFAESDYGNTSVTSSYARTTGNDSIGIDAYGNHSAYVHNTGYVETTGSGSIGIDASSEYGPTTVVSHTVITTGDHSDAIFTYAYQGNVSVTSTNAVTHGNYSYAISASAYTGNVTVNSGNAITYGAHSPAVYAYTNIGDISVTSGLAVTHGDFSPGIKAYAYVAGNVTVNSGTVVTYGNFSPGILALSASGNVSVTSGTVTTHGYESYGIEAGAYIGNVTINSGSVTTYGNYTPAIRGATGTGDVTITTTGNTYTHGYDSDAIQASTVYAGNVTVNTGGITHADDGVGVHIISAGYATVNNSGSIFGGRGGIVAYSYDGTTINNGVGASISGGNGYAIGTTGASTVINNYGTINGYVILDTANNTVNNFDRFNAYGNSYFGSGTNVFNNGPGGDVRVAPNSTSATTVVWTGLAAFNNEGLVDLRNGHTGDIFDLPGTTFTGSVNSTLGIDASLSAALSADELIIGPAAGSTTVVVNNVGGPAALNFVGVPVVQATAGSANAFVMAPIHDGFVDYGLSFNASTFTWSLVGLPGQPAFEFLKVPEMAEGFWRRTGDAWTAREQEIRDSMWGSDPGTRAEGWEMWGQAQIGGERLGGGNETFTVQGFTFNPNLRTDTDWRGFQMGADTLHGGFLWGVTGGFLEQNTIFHADRNSLDMSGWNFGGYAGFTSGHFFINGLLKGDWYSLNSNMPTVPAYESFNGNTWGVKGETGFRFGGHSFYVEPVADVAWTSTHLDDANFHALDTNFTFSNNTMARGSIGARFGGQWGSVMPYVGIYAVDEWDDNARLTMITGSGCPGSCFSIEDEHPGSYGKADLGFTTTSWNGLMGFVKVEDEFGSHIDGFIGRLGVRWRW